MTYQKKMLQGRYSFLLRENYTSETPECSYEQLQGKGMFGVQLNMGSRGTNGDWVSTSIGSVSAWIHTAELHYLKSTHMQV